MSALEELNTLLRRSRGFLETAKMQVNAGIYDLAAFSLEQALQLYLKAMLLKYGGEFPRTHSIKRLFEFLIKVVPSSKRDVINDLISKYILHLSLLEDAYITSRYVVREFSKDEVMALLKVVEEVLNLEL